ncbi:hypothetical protein KMZ15_05245 [Mycoavidus sp. HKI]|uniref:phage tail protein n=1 Tax=Mycoavidus sp. HKI TaxID=2840467 RepID=UPI001CBDB41E|nr:phage tail protein [Mycoavidus sp. HKI]UAW63505.1 hypothetical protein KMZ15_05245 [Mycoavidus sp. HKI]
MQQKFFTKPFAILGDREAVPNDTQITGDVSYEQGYGYDYQRDQAIDPLAKPIERTKLNAILHDITDVLQQYQACGTPEWVSAADNDGESFPYAQGARVRYRTNETEPWNLYESLGDHNTTAPSDPEKWMRVVSAIASVEQAVDGTDNHSIMTPLRVAQVIDVSIAFAIASEREAVEGIDNKTIMTPLRVKQAIATSSHHVGQIVFEARTNARVGYLKCDGAEIDRKTYSNLWEYTLASGALVDEAEWHKDKYGCFSSGDGVSTFRIPDLRGEFIRCWDDGRGIDQGRHIGSWQSDMTRVPYRGPGHGGGGAFTGSWQTEATESHNHNAPKEEAGTPNPGGTAENETRPRNIALLAMIRY